jgi:hypothetical protein
MYAVVYELRLTLVDPSVYFYKKMKVGEENLTKIQTLDKNNCRLCTRLYLYLNLRLKLRMRNKRNEKDKGQCVDVDESHHAVHSIESCMMYNNII